MTTMTTKTIRGGLFLALLLSTAVGSGCAQYTDLTLLTDAPPSRVAMVRVQQNGTDRQVQSIAVSAHIAAGLECTFVQTDQRRVQPCENLQITATPSSVVQILPAFLSDTAFQQRDSSNAYSSARDGIDGQGRDRSVVVLVGQQPGQATLSIAHDLDTIEIPIEVRAVDSL